MSNTTENDNNLVLFKKEEPTEWTYKGDNVTPPVLKDEAEYEIDEKTKVVVKKSSQFDVEFYDIYVKVADEERFLGRYLRETQNLRIGYNNGKILIYYGNYDRDTQKFSKVTKVINLYNVEDDMFYPVREAEALRMFNPELTLDELLTPDGSLVYYNADNKRDKTKNLDRFSYYGD